MITQAACDILFAASALQPAVVAFLVSRGGAPLFIEDCELNLVYSGESDNDSDSKKAEEAESNPEAAKLKLTESALRGSMSLGERCDTFGSSDESDDLYRHSTSQLTLTQCK